MCTAAVQINVQISSFATRCNLQNLHNMLNRYRDIYIAKTNRKLLNGATTEMEAERNKEKSGKS